MPSTSLARWNRIARARLDEVVQAHAAVGGTKPGRRATTLQIDHAYAMLLSSHFQAFCRDLHTEAADQLWAKLGDPWARPLFRARLVENRRLDRGNPNPGNIGADFERFGLAIWPALYARDARNTVRHAHLEKLNRWRNAIAHQDFADAEDLDLGGGRVVLRLADVAKWRRACDALAGEIDAEVGDHLAGLVGCAPW